MDEQNLIERYKRREPEAVSRLVQAHYDDLYRFLRQLTRHEQEAQDLTQATMMRALRALDRYTAEVSMRTWLHRIAYREFLRWRRGRRYFVAIDHRWGRTDSRLDQAIDAEALLSAIGKLPPALAATFLLFEVQDLSLEEVAKALDIPPGTVKSRLHEARRRLRRLLGSANEDLTHPKEIYEH